jgi:hypothetical protein
MVGSLHLDGVTEIVAFGDGTHEDSFNSYLVNRFNLQVRAPSPFESLSGDALAGGISLQPGEATHFATALGLALQTSGGAVNG